MDRSAGEIRTDQGMILVGEPGDAGSRLAFLESFIDGIPADRLRTAPVGDIQARSGSLYRLGQRRSAGETLIACTTGAVGDDGSLAVSAIELVVADMPHIIDAVTGILRDRGAQITDLLHPIIPVVRDGDGLMLRIDPDGVAESYVRIDCEPFLLTSTDLLATELRQTLDQVRRIEADQVALTDLCRQAAEAAGGDGAALIAWLGDGHFSLVGAAAPNGAPLGLLQWVDATMLANLAARVDGDDILVTRLPIRSPVTGLGWVDSVLIPVGRGTNRRLWLLAGHFTISAQTRSPLQIPVLSAKLAAVLAQLGFAPRSHNGRSAAAILEQTPRDELFALSEGELAGRVQMILDLHEKPGAELILRRDPLSRLVTAQMLLPTPRFTPILGEQIATMVAQRLGGRLLAAPQPVARGSLTCLHLTLDAVADGVDLAMLRPGLVQMAGEMLQSWSDRLRQTLLSERPGEGAALWARYETCFPAAYRDRYAAGRAVQDLRGIAGAMISRIAILIDDTTEPGVRVFHRGGPLQLYTLLPLLDGMGVRVVREFSVRLTPRGDEPVWLHDIGIELPPGTDLKDREAAFADLFRHLWSGQVESDGFNRLFLSAQLDSGQIVLLRAYAKYLRQASPAIGVRAIERALIQYPVIARLLVRMFAVRFDPMLDRERSPMLDALVAVLDRELAEVAGADDDRILRRLANLITATVRTNAYQRQPDGQPKPYLSFKFDCARIDDLPAPRPMAEIFVYSPAMEGIHLRGARVARGGLRWSDRREDFRTEILGLMKAQMVKNAVIVPMGSKGGFVVKAPDADPKQRRDQGIACYRTLIRGLLDITDTLVAGVVKPPADLVRYDGDDPYLVVAADKGTATFSDIANAIAEEYGFWLGDAFASGGSQGYDHKRMGITARGAWESVKRHFRELGRDVQTEPCRVVGVGDMSGDVFGNGLLQSWAVQLVAAFNHEHIFIDPTPDPAISYAERQRLFDLPGSSWGDYDLTKLSPGGAVFRRDAKILHLSPEAVAALDLPGSALAPDAVIQALLLAPVDLLFFGGIGTYVRAPQESDADAGDRTNDAVRVSADRLRCAVIAEGANLALTQPARIAYALAGGRINTDAVDNSAGVDCSDHEVNIKILLADAIAAGRLSVEARNDRLRAMTDAVAGLVLTDNIRQTGILSQLTRPAGGWGDAQIALLRRLEQEGRLDRALEHLPSDAALADRLSRGQGLTRPEHAVLLAYGKNWLAELLRDAAPITDPYLHRDLVAYFPAALHQDPTVSIADHPLANDILATVLANEIVNRLGPAPVFALIREDGRSPLAVLRAYVALRDMFDLPSYWQAVDALDGQVPADHQLDRLDQSARLLERAIPRLLEIEGEGFDLAALVADGQIIRPALERAVQMDQANQPESLAQLVAVLEIRAIQADQPQADLAEICRIYLRSNDRFGFDWLRHRASGLKGGAGWQGRAVAGLLDDLDTHHRRLTRRVLGDSRRGRAGQDLLDQWVLGRAQQMRRFDQVMAELRAVEAVDVSMLTVTNRMLAALTA